MKTRQDKGSEDYYRSQTVKYTLFLVDICRKQLFELVIYYNAKSPIKAFVKMLPVKPKFKSHV